MRYWIEPKDRIYVKSYGFLSFAKNLSNKYGQKLLDSAKKPTADAVKLIKKINSKNSRSNWWFNW